MSKPAVLDPAAPGDDCWNRIGIGGDRSCPELKIHVHCRNCPVFASAAKEFFDRPAPSGYLEEWTTWLGRIDERVEPTRAEESGAARAAALLIFRLDREWLAFRTQAVVEVALPRPVHRIPHRTNAVLNGLVNLRGQLQLCVSLHSLLGVRDSIAKPGGFAADAPSAPGEPADGPRRATSSERLVVLRDRERSEVWAFPTDEVHGVEHVPRGVLQSVPSTLANPAVSFSQAILPWNGRSVGFLDEQRVFAALRSTGQ